MLACDLAFQRPKVHWGRGSQPTAADENNQDPKITKRPQRPRVVR